MTTHLQRKAAAHPHLLAWLAEATVREARLCRRPSPPKAWASSSEPEAGLLLEALPRSSLTRPPTDASVLTDSSQRVLYGQSHGMEEQRRWTMPKLQPTAKRLVPQQAEHRKPRTILAIDLDQGPQERGQLHSKDQMSPDLLPQSQPLT
jgi:hypothetical protein